MFTLRLLQDVHDACSRHQTVDLSPSLSYWISLEKLQHEIKITGTALDWFKSYLSDRFHFFHLHDISSERTKVHRGVPQGSVLGPVLFSFPSLASSQM